jgi:hypothetical protein
MDSTDKYEQLAQASFRDRLSRGRLLVIFVVFLGAVASLIGVMNLIYGEGGPSIVTSGRDSAIVAGGGGGATRSVDADATATHRRIPAGGDLRSVVMVFVLVAITAFGGVCVYIFLTSKDRERIKFADSMLRTIVGFYIGIVTGLLGIR